MALDQQKQHIKSQAVYDTSNALLPQVKSTEFLRYISVQSCVAESLRADGSWSLHYTTLTVTARIHGVSGVNLFLAAVSPFVL